MWCWADPRQPASAKHDVQPDVSVQLGGRTQGARRMVVVGELGDPDTTFYLLDALKCLALNEEGLLETSK